MVKKYSILFIALFLLLLPIGLTEAADTKQRVFDEAGLLTASEIDALEKLSSEYSEKNETDFVFLTTNGADDKGLDNYVEDFADRTGIGYGKHNGSAAIVGIDMVNRDVVLRGFDKAEEYLDNQRMDLLRDKITPELSAGSYYDAFSNFILTADKYMEYNPGVNPESILFKWWFQLGASLALGGIIVGLMAFNSGGRVTVNSRTYFEENNSRINSKRDVFVNQTVSKVKKPTNNNNGGGSSGGGVTSGGRSFSGSSGKF
ncbi:TPM domain-containing protein [uncultured Psychrobacillus sp.]|uniref:TPM domain-containing protein n=1 Tax=uncultured Psychrobacillus sp. TaxID=1551585 RepID=UPI00261EB925|nr:TPM domain-containing protein [uncultured Psychrobacillus sp.]